MTVQIRHKTDDTGVEIVNGQSAWLQTFSGKKVSLPTPNLDEICLEDIVTALSKQCRYNGHCKHFYSVAQHCVLGSQLAQFMGFSVEDQKNFLLHDATEAYIGDIIRPVKRGLPDFQKLEEVFWEVIAKKFGLTKPLGWENHDLDNYMLVWEKEKLLPNSQSWPNLPSVPEEAHKIFSGETFWLPTQAENRFYRRYLQLFEGHP